MTESFEYAVPADDRSAPRHSVVLACGFLLAFLAALFLFAASPAHAQQAAAPLDARPAISIAYVNVVDVERGVILADMRVEVRSGRITFVGKEDRRLGRPSPDVMINGSG